MTQAKMRVSTPPRNTPKDKNDRLVAAAAGLAAADRAIADMHKRFGDDADSRDDYIALREKLNDHIGTLVTVRASSAAGITAKAEALRLRRMIEDYSQHQQIAVSLADDLVRMILASDLPLNTSPSKRRTQAVAAISR
jgi:hypothetical protein